jgi:hypothetical protein
MPYQQAFARGKTETDMPTTTKRMIELSAIALQFRSDCLRFADCTDIGEDLRQRFREDAERWATISHKILRTDWVSDLFFDGPGPASGDQSYGKATN